MNLLVSPIQANSEEIDFREKAEEEVWRSVVLTEWERTCLPPQNKEVHLISILYGYYKSSTFLQLHFSAHNSYNAPFAPSYKISPALTCNYTVHIFVDATGFS